MRLLLTSSLVLNLVFMLLAAYSGSGQRKGVPARVIRTNGIPFRPALRIDPGMPMSYATPWQALAAKDYRAVIDGLRQAGCPEATIRDLIALRVAREFQTRWMASETARIRRPDWWREEALPPGTKPWTSGTVQTAFLRFRESRHLLTEMQTQLRELFGSSAESLAQELGGWPAPPPDTWLADDKWKALRIMRDRFTEEQEDVSNGFGGTPFEVFTAEQKTQMAELHARQRAELAGLLTPSEVEAYDLHYSEAANYARQSPKIPAARDEAEFRAIVKALQESQANLKDSLLKDLGVVDLESSISADTDHQRIVANLKPVLGEDRLAAQQQAEVERKKAEELAQEEADQKQFLTRLEKIAEEVGADAAAAKRYWDLMQISKKDLDARFPDTGPLTEAQRREHKQVVKAEIDRMGREAMGDKGPAFVKKLLSGER